MKIFIFKIIIFCFCIFVLGCKSTHKATNKVYNIKLVDYVNMIYKKGYITNNPLIIINSKPYKLFSELSEEDTEIMDQPIKNYSYFKKNQSCFKKHLGEDALNGIIHIKNKIVLRY